MPRYAVGLNAIVPLALVVDALDPEAAETAVLSRLEDHGFDDIDWIDSALYEDVEVVVAEERAALTPQPEEPIWIGSNAIDPFLRRWMALDDSVIGIVGPWAGPLNFRSYFDFMAWLGRHNPPAGWFNYSYERFCRELEYLQAEEDAEVGSDVRARAEP